MTLREQLEHDGQRLFQLRSYTPLIPLAAATLWLINARHLPAPSLTFRVSLDVLCIVVGLLGVAIRMVTIGYTPKGASGRTTKTPRASVLNTIGPYSVVRHPLYVGSFLMWLAVAAYSHGWPIAIIVIAWFWIQYERIALAEESFLRKQFGAAFEAWAAKTPAFLPALRNWQPPGEPFSWTRAIRREASGFLGLAVALVLLDAVRSVSRTGALDIRTAPAVLLASAAIMYVVGMVQRKLRPGLKKTSV